MSTTTQFETIESGTEADRIGLALGGGGARGLAHILVLEAFDELGLKPVMIAGTSIGAIFGGAYALGLGAREIRERAEKILTNPAEIARRLFSGTPKDWLELWTLRPFSASLMNAEKLVHIVLPEAEGAQFEHTRIPFKAAATDYREQKLVTLETGDLAQAIAASMALPSIFRAIEHDDHALADGGLVNPLPYDLLPSQCTVTVAIDVTGHLRLPEDRPPTALEAVLASSQIMQNAIVREKLKSERPDILIRPPVDQFRILEFYKIRAILKAALPIKEELKRGLDAKLSGVREKTI